MAASTQAERGLGRRQGEILEILDPDMMDGLGNHRLIGREDRVINLLEMTPALFLLGRVLDQVRLEMIRDRR